MRLFGLGQDVDTVVSYDHVAGRGRVRVGRPIVIERLDFLRVNPSEAVVSRQLGEFVQPRLPRWAGRCARLCVRFRVIRRLLFGQSGHLLS